MSALDPEAQRNEKLRLKTPNLMPYTEQEGIALATLDSSSLCCLHFATCQNVMVAVCIITLFPSLQAQN